MHTAPLKQLVAQCSGLCLRSEADFELLRRFVERRDAEAFAQLVYRHAGLVWGVCRRLLAREVDCDDAFQATFLALARQAPRLDQRAPLGGWLHTIAVRIARKALLRSWRGGARALTDDHPAVADVGREVSSRELLRIVDEEIERLPETLRPPLVLCCLEGRTRDEAAEVIGCSVAAVKSRLERAREHLRRRLERRGIELPAAFLILGLGTDRVRATLVRAAITSALGSASPSVLKLAAVASPWPSKLAGGAVAFAAASLLGLGAFCLAQANAKHDSAVPPQKAVEAVFQADESRPLTDSLGDPLPEAALLRLGTTRFRHPNSAHALALPPDGKTVVTLGWQGLFCWDTATGKQRWRADPKELQRDLNPAVGASPLVFTPDGKSCITLADNLAFKTWDVETGNATTTRLTVPFAVDKRGQPNELTSLDLSPDGKTLALGSAHGMLLCNRSGAVMARIDNKPVEPPPDPNKDRLLAWRHFSYGRFPPDGKTLAVVTSDAADVVKLCDAADGKELRRIQLSKRYLDSGFSPDGTLLAVAERDDTVRVYEVATGKRVHAWPVTIRDANENYIFQVMFAPDGKTVVAASSDKLIHIWDVARGAEVGQLKGHGWYPWGLAFTSDSKVLYSTGWDGEIRRWDLAERRQFPLPFGVRGSSLIAAAPDGRSVVYVGGDSLHFVDVKDSRELRTLKPPEVRPSQLQFAPDGRSLAIGGSSGDNVVVCVLDVSSAKVTRRWQWPKGRDPHAAVEELAFTADGRRLAAMTFRHGQARVWDLYDKDQPLVLLHPEGYSLAFTPDGKTLVTAGWDKKLRFWEPTTGKLKKEFVVAPPKHEVPGVRDATDTRLYAVAVSPDGTRIAAGDLTGLLWLWDADSMDVKFVVYTGDHYTYNCVAFSPDGLWLTTGASGGKVKIWDAATGQLVWDRGAHAGYVFRVSFGRDSRRLLTGGSDGVGYLWDLRPKELPTKKPEELWNDLLGENGPAVYGAFWALLEQPDSAVALLTERGKQALAKVPADKIEQWIRDLDSAAFATRETAAKELSKHLLAAAPHLRKALPKTASLEQQRRLQRLIDESNQQRSRVDLLVSLLAHLETPAAQRLLSHWAESDPDGAIGRAAAVLQRMR